MSVHLAIARAAQQCPNSPAVRGDGYERSWGETADRVARLAAGLLRLGLQRGDRLALLAGNNAEHFELANSAIWAGIVIVPLNIRLSPPELGTILADSGARAIAFDAAFAETAAGLAAQRGISIAIAMETELDRLLSAPALLPLSAAPTDLLGLFYTGGTTGAPKGVALSHISSHLTAIDQAVGMEVDAGSVYLHAAPMFHLADITNGNAVTYMMGTHVFSSDVSAAGVLRAIEYHNINFLMLVPTMFHDLVEKAGDNPLLHRITNAVYGAAPISEGLLVRMLRALPNARFKQAYGQSEIGGACVILPAEDHVVGNPRLASAGKATISAYIRIVDAEGREVPRGTSGEIVVSSPRIMNGYWNLPEQTAATVREGWLHTGDMGVMDDGGYIRIVDRLKDMIVSGGENVFCAEVENAMSTHPDVARVAVVGVPDERWGEAVHAFVVAAEGSSPDAAALISHARSTIAGYKCPKDITFVTTLPLSGVGKVRKDVLRAAWTKPRKEA